MIRLRLTDPKALTLAAGTGMTAWGATGFSTDIKKVLMFVVPSFMGGAAVPHNPTANQTSHLNLTSLRRIKTISPSNFFISTHPHLIGGGLFCLLPFSQGEV